MILVVDSGDGIDEMEFNKLAKAILPCKKPPVGNFARAIFLS